MRRRTFLLRSGSGCIALIAGCASEKEATVHENHSETLSTTSSETLSTTSPETVSPNFVCEPSTEFPRPPTDLSENSALSYAKGIDEEYYRENRLPREGNNFSYRIRNGNATRNNGDYLVSFEVDVSWTQGSSGPETEHADDSYEVTYFVSSSATVRQEGSTDADPIKEPRGQVLFCHSDN